MKKVWITYAWKDNEDKDIDFIIQQLDKTTLDVRFDRRNLVPGQRLWTQIGGMITDPNECDAWGVILTANSIGSQACIEELSYALARSLSTKGGDFPVFALLQKIEPSQLPPALKVRLCISLENNDWVKQVVAAASKNPPGFIPSGLTDFVFHEHTAVDGFCLEIRPRFDRISPFAVCVDYSERMSGNVTSCSPGPADQIPNGHCAIDFIDQETTLTDGTRAWVWGSNNEANSTSSYYLFYKKRPTRIWYGHQQNLRLLSL